MKRKIFELEEDEQGWKKIIKFEEGWSYILSGVTKLKRILDGELELPFDSYQHMGLYTTIYHMCTQKPPHDYTYELYNKYCELIEDYADQTVLLSLSKKHDKYMLKEFARRWSNHKVLVRWLCFIFRYIERFFLAKRSLPTLKEYAMKCFRNLVYKEMRSKAKDAILALIHREREGEQIDRAILKNVLDVYVEMKKYEDDFERFMLQDTASYYSRKASSWIHDGSCPEYMLKAEDCLKREKEKATHYLHSRTEPKLLEIVQNELLVVFAKQLLENEHSGCRALLRDNKLDDLARMYRLYHSFPQWLGLIADFFKKHITAEGTIIIKQAEDATTNQAANTFGEEEQLVRLQVLIGIVIDLHNKYMVYVTECFQNHFLFYKIMKEAFENFWNKKVAGSSKAELLATFCDNLLKKRGKEKLSDETIEATLDNVVTFLAYTSEKDLFAEFYGKKLASRLLFDRSGIDEHERSFVTKLKEEFGWDFTSKMEGMVMDMTLARESQKNFVEYLNSNVTANPGINLTVTVLTTGFWPSYRTCDLNLPTEMVKCVEVFKAFYETKTKHRRLRWIYSLGTCHIIGTFDQEPIELIVSTYQAAVLLIFNNTERLSYNEILEQLNLSHEDLVRQLHSLSCAKYKILNKEPNSSSISQTDVFEFNSKFTNRMRKIKIPLPPMNEWKKVVEDVDRDRRYAIDATLVRIMKSRKMLGHQQLVSDCVEQLSRMFKPDIKMIKKRIEALINRDYLERVNETHNMLKYLA